MDMSPETVPASPLAIPASMKKGPTMPLCVRSSGCLALGVLLLAASTAMAQLDWDKKRERPKPPPLQPIKTSGMLVSSGPNAVQLLTNQKQAIFVMVGPGTQVTVTGTAEQDYLKSGVTVEFTAAVDKEGAVKDKIGHLAVVSLAADRPAGLFPPDVPLEKKGDKPEEEKLLLPSDLEAAQKARGKKDAAGLGSGLSGGNSAKGRGSRPRLPGAFTVRGTIKLCKEGKITVAVGRGPTIKAELARDVKIDVNMADFRAAQRGDRVEASGLTSEARPNVVLAESITINLANPLSGPKKHAARPGKTPAADAGRAK